VYKYGVKADTVRIQGFLRGTATSLMTRPPPFIELKKAESMNQVMPMILKKSQPID
jgi:hypothetical protein